MPSPWAVEDGDAGRRQVPHDVSGLALADGEHLTATFRPEVACTMVVWDGEGALFLLAHTLGADTVAHVERIDPITLECRRRSVDLPGGPMWPGGLAIGAHGDLLVVYGRWCHRLDPFDLRIIAARELPGPRPYNSFTLLADGTLVTKDFAKDGDTPSRLWALDPISLAPRADVMLPERSIARVSSDDMTTYVVGDTHVWRVELGTSGFHVEETFAPRYLTEPGQTYGWDAVLALDAAWFLDGGEGTDRYAGTFRGRGVTEAPVHLVRVGLDDGSVTRSEICGRPNGLIANPPVVDERRGIAVGFDSANAVLTAFDIDSTHGLSVRWQRQQDHAAHMILYPDTGELVTHDHDAQVMAEHVVVRDIDSGVERGRVATGSPVQSVQFPAPGTRRDLYSCTFAGISRVAVEPS